MALRMLGAKDTAPTAEPAARHFVSNVIIRPGERGATGTQYEAVFAVGHDGKQSAIARTGRYEDTYTKTPAGWRIQKREFFPSVTTREADKAAVPQAHRPRSRSSQAMS